MQQQLDFLCPTNYDGSLQGAVKLTLCYVSQFLVQVYRDLKEVTPEAMQMVKRNFEWVAERVQVHTHTRMRTSLLLSITALLLLALLDT